MKYFGVIAFVAFAATLLAISEGTNSTWGFPGTRDILLHREVVILDWKFLRVVEHDVIFNPRNTNRTITAVRAIDFTKGNKGGEAFLTRGGPGFRNATVHLRSQRNQGLNYAIEILGH